MEQYKLNKKQKIEKRIFDVIISIIVIIITSPIMILIAIAIKIDSKGPVIYKQKRITKDGKEFTMYKFRTMIDNAEKELPEYRIREQVKVGITCIAHIEGDYYTEPKVRLEYDKMYMKDWSIKKDIKIIFKTILKVIKEL